MTETTPPTDKATLEICDDKHRLSDEEIRCIHTYLVEVECADPADEEVVGYAWRYIKELRTSLAAANKRAEEAEQRTAQVVAERNNFFRGLFSRQHLQIQALNGRLSAAKKALEPFAWFGSRNTEADVEDTPRWSGLRCENERIVDWFGPTDFYEARDTLSRITEANTQENKEE